MYPSGKEDMRVQAILALMESQNETARYIYADYRCEQGGCSLLKLFVLPEGLAYYMKRHKKSSEASRRGPNAGSRQQVERERRDGFVPARAGLVPSLGILTLNCDHILGLPINVEALQIGKEGYPIVVTVSPTRPGVSIRD